MTDAQAMNRYLEVFPAWLRSLGEDAAALGALVEGEARDDLRRHVVGSLNYIFKSLDLIADGIDDLGYCDDAFVLRVAARLAVEADPNAKVGVVERLADDARAIEEFLGEDYAPLVVYVRALATDATRGAARGRTVDEILGEPTIRAAFVREVAAWAADYQTPSFTRDIRTLVKLKSFLHAKLA